MAKTKTQSEIPGTERQTIPELDAASIKANDCKLVRVEASNAETAANEELMQLMREHKRKIYVNHKAAPPITVQLIESKAKVTTKQETKEPKAKKGKRDA